METTAPALHAGFLSHALWAMGAVALYAAFTHLSLALRGGGHTLHLSFAAMALAMAVNLPVSALAYQAVSIPDLIWQTKVLNTSAAVFLLGLLWFLPAYADHEPRGVKAVLAPTVLFLAALAWLRPQGLIFDRVEAIVPDQTPWGEYLAVAQGEYSVWTRVHPLPMLAIMATGFYLSFRLLRAGRKRRGGLLAVALGLVLASVVGSIWHDLHGRRGKLRGVELGAMAMILLMGGELAAEAASARRTRAALRKLAAESVSIEERERRRLAQGLHDQPLQKIALAHLHIQRQGRGAEAPILTQASALLEEAVEDLRGAVFELSPALLHKAGLDAALRQLAEDTATRSGLDARFAATGSEPVLDETGRTVLYQGARELAVNAVKHAEAQTLSIERLCPPGAVAVRVCDDGKGLAPRIPERPQRGGRHFGLNSLEERLTALGGRVDIASGADGTRVTLTLPMKERPNDASQNPDRG